MVYQCCSLKEIFCTSLTSASFLIVVGFLANGRKSYEKRRSHMKKRMNGHVVFNFARFWNNENISSKIYGKWLINR